MKSKNVTYKTLESKEIYKEKNTRYNLELKESSDKEKNNPIFLGITKITLGENNKEWINYKPSFPLEIGFFENLVKEVKPILKKYSSKIENKSSDNNEKQLLKLLKSLDKDTLSKLLGKN